MPLTQAHPVSPNFVPADHGLLGWSFDPTYTSGSTALAAGVVRLTRARMHTPGPITSIRYFIGVAGATISNCYIAVWDLAGSRIGVTADLSAAWTSANVKTTALAAPTISLPPGTEVLVGFLAGAGAPVPSMGSLAGSTSTMANVGLTAATTAFRAATYSSGLTATPSPLTLATQASANQPLWVGLL